MVLLSKLQYLHERCLQVGSVKFSARFLLERLKCFPFAHSPAQSFLEKSLCCPNTLPGLKARNETNSLQVVGGKKLKAPTANLETKETKLDKKTRKPKNSCQRRQTISLNCEI